MTGVAQNLTLPNLNIIGFVQNMAAFLLKMTGFDLIMTGCHKYD